MFTTTLGLRLRLGLVRRTTTMTLVRTVYTMVVRLRVFGCSELILMCRPRGQRGSGTLCERCYLTDGRQWKVWRALRLPEHGSSVRVGGEPGDGR